MRKQLIIITMTIIMLSLLSACGGNDSDASTNESGDKKKLVVASYSSPDDALSIALNEVFKEKVEEGTDGAIQVDIQDNNKLGDEEEYLKSTKSGSVQMAITGTGVISNEVPKVDVLTLPFLFEDPNQVLEILESPIGEELVEGFDDMGLHFLGFSPQGYKSYTSNKPINSMEDFKGLGLRVATGYPMQVEFAKAIGAKPTPIDWSEVFTSLETGVIEAQANPVDVVYQTQLYEVQKYLLDTKHFFTASTYGINNDFWESLSDEQQEIIQTAATEAQAYEFEMVLEREKESKKALEEVGMEILDFDEDFKSNLIEATEPVYDWYYEENEWAEELVEKIKNEIE